MVEFYTLRITAKRQPSGHAGWPEERCRIAGWHGGVIATYRNTTQYPHMITHSSTTNETTVTGVWG